MRICKSFVGVRAMLLVAAFFVASISAGAQTQKKTVSGVVLDEFATPLPGVSVLEKGTTNGTITDLDGAWKLTVPGNSTIEISCVGYKTVDLPSSDVPKTLQLEPDNEMLDELVVVGYGVQKKSSLTGAVSSVKSEDMQSRTITTASQALQGKTAGVQVLSSSAKPGSSPSVQIRGVSSNSGSSPLFVVDGRVTKDIAGIDPNDIESMEVLKDGASAAIYGVAAGNGVILITTKKGQGDGKVSYEYQLTSQGIGHVPHTMNAEQYIEYFTEPGYITMDKIYQSWDFKTNTNWADAAFENSMMQRHNASFMAGNDKGSLYMSLTYLNNDGMVKGDRDFYERLTGMVNASWKVKKWIEVGTNNQIEHYKSRSVGENTEYGSPLLSVIHMDPLTPVTYADGKVPEHVQALIDKQDTAGEVLKDENGHYYGISNFITSNSINPLIQRDSSTGEGQGFNINGTTFINLTPIKGLVATSRLSYSLSHTESYGVSFDYQGAAQQNASSVLSVSGSSYGSTYYQWENFINYNTLIGKHSLGLMAGSSMSSSRSYGVSGSMTGSDDKGFKQDNEKFWFWSSATATAIKSLSGAEPSLSRKVGFFGRATWDYEGKYMAQASLRADAADSSVLPLQKRWGFFPAVSGGWVLSRENFMNDTRSWLDFLKVRASWGRNGATSGLGGYRYMNVIASSGSYPVSVTSPEYIVGYAPTSTGNQELQWETHEQTDLGIDARFLANRLSVSVDYYNKNTKDLIISGITPSTVVGISASPINAGNITNKGIEIEVGWNSRIGELNYGVRANMATLKNQVVSIHETLSKLDGTSYHSYGAITRFEVGQPAWYFYGYKCAGIDPQTGNPLFYTKDNTVTDNPVADDKTYIGKGMADMNYGITLTASWKGFDFILFGTGSYGNDIFCCLNRTDYYVNKLTDFTENRWKSTNTAEQNAKVTRPAAGASGLDQYMVSDALVYDGSYFKIKQIQLGYNLPQNILKRINIENVRVYGSLDDFFTFTKYPGFDPEVTGVGSGLGVDKGTYPTSRKVVFGFNVTF